jgi:hypothetical protein
VSEPRRFHTTMSLGEKRHVTSEGFLVCLDVPMARTGDMLYGPEETPVHSADGVTGVTITRDEDEVFRPDTVLSIIGKPVTNDHPDELVVPGNWAGTAVGHVVSARRGTGADASLLLGDIMICEPQAIQDVLSGKVEVSAGYDADYEETGPGRGRQRNIYYNHLALVDKGRCGPRCAIGDYQPEELDMAVKTKKSVIVKDSGSLVARLRNLMSSGVTVKDADIEEALEKEGTSDDITGSGTEGLGQIHIHMGGGGEKPNAVADDVVDPPNPNGGEPEKKTIEPEVEARFQGIETALKQIAAAVQKLMPEENETAEAEELVEEAPDNVDEKTVVAAKDSAFYVETFAETAQMAEVIVPGIRVPTFDREAKPAKTVDALCKFRKTVLDLAYARPDTQALVHDLAGGKKLDTKCMTCDKVRNTFRALFVAKRNSNNESATRDMRVPNSGGAVETTSPIKSIGDLTKFLAEKHKKSA